MNKTDMLEIMQKRSPYLTVFSVVFVGAMVFLIPNLIEEAHAVIRAFVTPHGGTFSDVKGTMTEGTFRTEPKETYPGSTIYEWTTNPPTLFGSEKGTVEANFNNLGKVTFSFSNPASGDNTCNITRDLPVFVTCTITQGNYAVANFDVYYRAQQNPNNFCDLLPKFGGLDQLKIVREKLHC